MQPRAQFVTAMLGSALRARPMNLEITVAVTRTCGAELPGALSKNSKSTEISVATHDVKRESHAHGLRLCLEDTRTSNDLGGDHPCPTTEVP
jgi:hypothetical protein